LDSSSGIITLEGEVEEGKYELMAKANADGQEITTEVKIHILKTNDNIHIPL